MRSLGEEIVRSYEDRIAEVAQLRERVKADLKEFGDSRAAMGRGLRADLAKGRADLIRDVRQQRADLAKGRADLIKDVRQRSAEVNAWIKEVANAHADARGEWQNLTITMQARRAGTAAPSPPVEEELRNRVFTYLANHPDGIRMAELEQVFGVPRIQMAGVLKSFIAQNKVQKRGLLYFAI